VNSGGSFNSWAAIPAKARWLLKNRVDEMSAVNACGGISRGLNNLFIKNHSTLTTTSTALGRVRGFSIILLLLLSKGVKRCCELAEETQKSTDYVYSYLKRLQKYGLADISESFWSLTDLGAWFVEYIKRNSAINDIILKSEQKENRRRTLKEQKENKNGQIDIALWSKSTDLSGVEKEVVEVLVNHYNKTGSKFILFRDMYDLAEKIKGSPEAVFAAIQKVETGQHRLPLPFRISGILEAWVEERIRRSQTQ